ncbi:hypothetical protein BGZ61DRAFT_445539 [Ilyonectria robusta]|uniref:uncharacterized protein n=1 Tax=Ilyonectria robusta TaxID=1079257 RepID=UPI001E8DE41C|nr:uncharacterized protein BGZ61DRAFT_445539 [Ilyonectria robusta]KAH8733929.1 hypothetical protein BGZ61DRAFT_445539 [Ilyonectria robusta]
MFGTILNVIKYSNSCGIICCILTFVNVSGRSLQPFPFSRFTAHAIDSKPWWITFFLAFH